MMFFKGSQLNSVREVEKASATQGEDDWWSPFLHEPCEPDVAVRKFEEFVSEDEHVYEQRGVFGETVLHWTSLVCTPGGRARAINNWLLDHAPGWLLNAQYDWKKSRSNFGALDTRGLYDGETALHIIFVRRDMQALARLLSRQGEVALDIRAYGTFFDPGSSTGTYYGEYPLSFAVSVGWLEGIDKLAAYAGAEEFRRLVSLADSHGNDAFHMAVLHRKPAVLKWLLDRMTAMDTPFKAGALLSHRNALGMTPVSLAGLTNDKDCMDVALKYLFKTRWSFGAVHSYSLPLTQIDTTFYGTAYDPMYRALLEVCIMQRAHSFMAHPLIIELLEKKWSSFGRFIYRMCFVVEVAYLFVLWALCILFAEASEGDALSNQVKLLERVLAAFQVLTATLVLFDLGGALWSRRRKAHIRTKAIDAIRMPAGVTDKDVEDIRSKSSRMAGQAPRTDNLTISMYDVIDLLGSAFLMVHVALALTSGKGQVASTCLSLGIVLAWQAGMQLFFAWQHFGVLVIIIRRVVVKDVSSFVVLLLMNVVGFSQALVVLEVDPTADFKSPLWGTLTMFRVVLGEKPGFTKFSGASERLDSAWLLGAVPVALYVLFTLCAAIVLLRLLISMFNQTYGQVLKRSEEEWRLMLGLWLLKQERRLLLLGGEYVSARISASNSDHGEHEYNFVRMVEIQDKADLSELPRLKEENAVLTEQVAKKNKALQQLRRQLLAAQDQLSAFAHGDARMNAGFQMFSAEQDLCMVPNASKVSSCAAANPGKELDGTSTCSAVPGIVAFEPTEQR